MLLSLSECFIISRMFIICLCAPKLERLLSNTISSESNYLENDIIAPRENIPILRTSVKSQEISKNDCAGYNYDATKCKFVKDRILCGYNKNIGEFNNHKDVIDLGHGCQMRGDRIECGYLVGPFVNPRRPPAYDNGEEYTEQTTRKATNAINFLHLTETNTAIENTKPGSKLVITKTSTTIGTVKPIPETLATKKITNINTSITKQKPLFSTIVEMLSNKTDKFNPTSTTLKITTPTKKSTVDISTKKKPLNCVEKDDRIVCYKF